MRLHTHTHAHAHTHEHTQNTHKAHTNTHTHTHTHTNTHTRACAQNGRIKGEAKKALRAVIEKYGIPVTITANQNLILREIEPAWKADLLATLGAAGIKDVTEWDSIERWVQGKGVP